MKKIKIGNGAPVFIIAEVSANHGQDINEAISLIKKAKAAGADAVKFQAYTPDTMTIDSDKKCFQVKHDKWGGQTLYNLYKKAYTPWKWFKKLKKVADKLGIMFFATAFDKTSVDMLENLNVSIYKIASFELIDLPLIEYIAKTGKPLIMSTGMASLLEIKEAVVAAKKGGAKEIILLKCVSSYPADPKEMNLRTIGDMKRIFKCSVGLSDHTLGIGVSIAGVSLGAEVVEKHFITSRKNKSVDSFFSLEPQELKMLVDNIRMVEQALGKVSYGVKGEQRNMRFFRRSLFVVENLAKGEVFTEDNVFSIRPANGLAPKYFKKIIGKKAKKNIYKGTPLTMDMVM